MTIKNVISRFKRLKPNQMNTDDLLLWISNVDAAVCMEILQPRTKEIIQLPVYTAADDTEVLIPSPFLDAYMYYLAAMTDYWTQDTDGYNNNMFAYTTAFNNYRDYFNRSAAVLCRQGIMV